MDHQLLDIFLFSLTTIGWGVAYIDAIRIGNKQKTYCIPFLALALNLTWELIAPIYYRVLTFYSGTYILWFFLDLFIVSTYFKYGYPEFKEMTGGSHKSFTAWSVVVIIVAFLWQLICLYTLTDYLIVSAFNMNLLMSVLFIYMLWRRKSSKGQSLVIAIAKSFGTLGPLLQGFFTMHNMQMWGWGALAYIFDLLYIVLLYQTIKREKLVHNKRKK